MKPFILPDPFTRILKNEDWLAILIAFLFMLLSVVGLLGQNGIKIGF